MESVSLLGDGNAYNESVFGWGEAGKDIMHNDKIRITFTGKKPRVGYAYCPKWQGGLRGIRYTANSGKWWDLLNYNNPLIKLEVIDNSREIS